jgi:hypothetical protein
MLDNVVADRDFAKIMKSSIVDLIVHFFQKEQNFGILCNIADASFEPQLPENINSNFRQLTLFFLAGYTFETARIDGDYLVFEAGFGEENFGSVVTVPLLSIMQIIVDETPVFINLSTYKESEKEQEVEEKNIDEGGVKNSMASFLSNPENSKFLK